MKPMNARIALVLASATAAGLGGCAGKSDMARSAGPTTAPAVAEMGLPAPTPIAVGESKDGRLEASDLVLPGGEYVDEYALAGMAGQSLSVRLESDEFDAYLILLDPDAETKQIDNDDFGSGRNSGIDIELTTSGTVYFGATSYGAGDTGGYRLSVSEGSGGS